MASSGEEEQANIGPRGNTLDQVLATMYVRAKLPEDKAKDDWDGSLKDNTVRGVASGSERANFPQDLLILCNIFLTQLPPTPTRTCGLATHIHSIPRTEVSEGLRIICHGGHVSQQSLHPSAPGTMHPCFHHSHPVRICHLGISPPFPRQIFSLYNLLSFGKEHL